MKRRGLKDSSEAELLNEGGGRGKISLKLMENNLIFKKIYVLKLLDLIEHRFLIHGLYKI